MKILYKKMPPAFLFSLLLLLSSCSSVNSEYEATAESEEIYDTTSGGTDTPNGSTDNNTEGALTEKSENDGENNDDEAQFPPPEEDIVYGNFSEDILNRVIIAELAGQRGLNQQAHETYMALARETKDLNIIKRAMRIAAFSRNSGDIIEMGNLWLELDPDSIEAHQTIAFQLVTQSRYGKALDHLTRQMELGVDVDFRLITAGTSTDSSAAFILDSLITDFIELSQRYPDNNSLNLALANLYRQNEQIQEAYEEVSNLAVKMNDAPEIVILEVQLLEQLGETEKARERLQLSLDTNPEHKQLRFLLGRKLVDEQRYNEAMEQFAVIVEQNPNDYDMLYSLALISMEVSRFNDARGYFQRLIVNSQRLDDSHYYLAYISTQENDIDRAIEHYLLVNAGSNFLTAQRNVTQLMIQQGHYREASSRLQNIRFRNSDYNIQLLSMEANLLLEEEMLEEAKLFLNNAVGAFPNNLNLLFLRSILSTNLNDLDLMEKDLRKIIRLDPNNAQAYNSLGYTLADRTERYDEAYSLIKRAITLAPNDAAIIDSMGWIQYQLGLYEEARDSLERAFELFPDHEVAAHLGEVLWALGKKREANRIWQSALELQPDSVFIRETMDRLKSTPSI